MAKKFRANKSEVVRYLLDSHYDGEIANLSAVTSFSAQQINDWINQIKVPHSSSVDWIMHKTFAPEFQVIAEYAPVDPPVEKTIRSQLASIFCGHENSGGVYAFYDSMVNLIYVGKSENNLLGECNTRIRASMPKGIFPKGAKQPENRADVVRYVSAYYVQASDFEDYAKHIESLILRISKPVLNSYIGSLQKAKPPQKS